ncbi:MAG: multicopper oxidase domain-containing protein [Acidobacteria bacterium]|nr:multicopper oxidase domain-containing protein [Acidobacteriota bacterium]
MTFEAKLHDRKNHSLAVVAVAVVLLQALPAGAQSSDAGSTSQVRCLPTQQDLVKVPELISKDGRLRATFTVTSELDRLAFRNPPKTNGKATQPGDPSAFSACFNQYVRAFRSPDAVPPYPPYPPQAGGFADPLPGPTLRARVGDVIELAFLNNVDPGNFGNSIDRGDTGACDETSAPYPGTDPKGDKFPNCFHGSTTANLHFHGTHTNPNTTGDNVFLEILSARRLAGGAPVTPESVRPVFDQFFDRCESELAKGSHREWPRKWADLPKDWTDEQRRLLKTLDEQPGNGRKLWPVDQAQLDEGAWPQYYLGSYPYCFKLPEYPGTPAPAAGHAAMPAMQMDGEGSAELDGAAASVQLNEDQPTHDLQMGQSPGTHWYHAHKHGSTAIDVENGMSGAFIIEGQYDDELNEKYKAYGPDWTRRQPVLVINQFGVSPNLKAPGGGQDKGPDFSVNGRMNPVIHMRPGEVQMWRIVNTSGRAGTHFLAPPAGLHWRQLAQDGVQFKDVNYQKSEDRSFLLAAGNRADLLVKAPDAACTDKQGCTYSVQVYNEVDPSDVTPPVPPSQGPPFKINLLTVKVSGTPYKPAMQLIAAAPSFPDFLRDVKDGEVTGTKTIAFATAKQTKPPTQPAIHTIDGKKFDGEVGAVVLLNKVEQWKVTNATLGISHPFHIHINPFQVVEVFSPNVKLPNGLPKYVTDKTGIQPGQCYLDPHGNPDDWKPCDGGGPSSKDEIWWDVFPIPSGLGATLADGTKIVDPVTQQQVIIPGYFKMRSRFVDYAGYFVIHCHILAHEDRGMMTVVEVAPLRSPYSHH